MPDLPVIVLAFANEQEGRRYLRDLPGELRQLQAILEAAERKGLCELVVRPNATLDQIFDVFTEHRDRVAIFHYGGHAGEDRLLLEAAGAGARSRTPRGWRRSSASGATCNWSSSTAARRGPRSPGCSRPG